MTLTQRLLAELARLGSATHPIARTLPGIVRDAQRYRLWAGLSLLLAGMVLGGAGALWIINQRLDAISLRNDMMAAACLNPSGKPLVTSKAASQVIVQQKEDARNR